jgi:hypothetical protein
MAKRTYLLVHGACKIEIILGRRKVSGCRGFCVRTLICDTVEATQASVRDGSASLVMSITASATAQSPIATPAVASKMVQHFPTVTAPPRSRAIDI